MTQDIVAFPRLTMLTHEQCEVVHHATLEILWRTGVRVYHDEALDLLRETDAVITDENLVHLPAGLVEWALKQAPSRIVLCKRGTSDGTLAQSRIGRDC
jgi:trimethylamine--corrinoid protein Co-methyltransferase